jgi:hypothetical protein
MASLQEFYQDVETRKNVQAYLIQVLTDLAVEKVFNREDTSAVAEAKEAVDKAFENMAELFTTKPEKNVLNQAR